MALGVFSCHRPLAQNTRKIATKKEAMPAAFFMPVRQKKLIAQAEASTDARDTRITANMAMC